VPLKYICVSGYGWSGSGAVVDLLQEFEGYVSLDIEFRLIKDAYGISDLENFLVYNWDVLRSDKAVKDFLWFTRVLNMKGSKFTRVGENLGERLYVDFLLESKKYVNSITKLSYFGSSLTFNYSLSNLRLFFRKLLIKFKIIANERKMYLAKLSKEDFLHYTQLYLDSIFKNFIAQRNADTLILDQPISATNIVNQLQYFNNAKLIVVDRDPRDIYVDLVNRKVLIGMDADVGYRHKRFVVWFKALRENITVNSDLLQLKFEDLIYSYDSEINKIYDFLEAAEYMHKNKKNKFMPKISQNNIGIWKNFKNQSEIDYIYKELKPYCFNL
jgi:hypothetical protein